MVASNILAQALFTEDKYSQSFPVFGVERRGAPVTAYIRFDDKPINLRCEIYQPDHIVILDASLVQTQDVTQGLKPGGVILINSDKSPGSFDLDKKYKVATVDASAIALDLHLGSVGMPIVNTAILGALAKATAIVSLDSIAMAISSYMPKRAEPNVEAARRAYQQVKM